jgi:hypothetical protein
MRAWARIGLALLARPRLWSTALRQARRLGFPPAPAYLEFRLTTQYGSGEVTPTPADVVSYLTWCQRMERLT